MEYNFRDIEEKWQQWWTDHKVYQVPNISGKPKYYVLDMFPYPSGAGLHVGHPLGYIASDIYARFKRLQGFNVLHPMGYDAFGLPAEQYAIEHGVHPAVSTEQNISTFRRQLDNIGFCFDWSREIRTSDPKYYKWTQWIFLQLFKSWYNRMTNRTEPIDTLIKIFEAEGNSNHPIPNSQFQIPEYPDVTFTAAAWKSFPEKTKQTILTEYRIAYCGYGEVNWCEALGTVLANDEVVNGVSERGGYPVEKKKLRQWYLRITEYADRLLEGLQRVDFSDAMKEMQSNWIGKSEGAEIWFDLTPGPSPSEMERGVDSSVEEPYPKYKVQDRIQFENARSNRKQSTDAEARLWKLLRDNQLGCKFRRQHPVEGFIADFACLQKGLIVEVDGDYHNTNEQQEYDTQRTELLTQKGFTVLRFTNEEVLQNISAVQDKIKQTIANQTETQTINDLAPLSIRDGEGPGVRCYTTRPDTIFGVDFMVLAPEHELVEKITTLKQKKAVEEYIAYVKSRSERERMAEKKITGVFTGAYAEHPFTHKPIPIWISEYVLAGYGTGAIMAVPSGDERDLKFAQHFNISVTNIFGEAFTGEEAITSKDAVLHNSDFLSGMTYKEAFEVVIAKLEEMGVGQRKVNYKMRDAAFSRQRYWGEPFPIVWKDGIAFPLDERELPLELPHVESYKPGPEGEGPLANIPEWTARHLETNTMPGYAGSSWYFLRYMDPNNEQVFCDKRFSDYWNQVDLYVGGTEHAVGHLLYSRMWTKALFDLGLISFDEPYKKLLNQGMIQGNSRLVYRL
ncbi:MAG: class I tRNA ligase family protein, partial [Flavisolibacter sp.]|nr:class I tRNA ligase family protein [Flavisolibacter sp.]